MKSKPPVIAAAHARAPEALLSWAREAGARHVQERDGRSHLSGLTVALVGCGRAGTQVADALARLGCGLLLVDPGTVGQASRNKAQALASRLRCLTPATAIALPVEHPAAIHALRRVDIVVSCVADDGARALCAILAAAFALPHLDLATGIGMEARRADLSLLMPGAGCIHCRGGLSHPQEIDRMRSSESCSPRRYTARPAGLRLLNGIAAQLVLGLIDGWARGEHQDGVSLRLEEQFPLRLGIAPVVASGSAESCPVCDVAGQGDAVLARLPDMLRKLARANKK